METTLGRVLFNETLPPGYPFVNYEIRKGQLSAIVNDLAERYPKVQLAATLDALKEAGSTGPPGPASPSASRTSSSRRASRRSSSGTRRRPSGSTSSTSAAS